MIGRLASVCEAWPCGPSSARTRVISAAPKAATAPNADVFTKSRRENVTESSLEATFLVDDLRSCDRQQVARKSFLGQEQHGCEGEAYHARAAGFTARFGGPEGRQYAGDHTLR